MGADMVTMTLPLPLGRLADWEAAARAVRDVRLEVLWDTGDLYDWESWLADTGNLPAALAAFTALRAAQAELHEHACLLRGAIEHGWPDELIELETPSHRVWVTGGPSWGEDPGDLVGPTIFLGESGVTDAIGFESYTRYDGPPIPQRSFGFAADDRRLTQFGVAVAHLAEEAASTEQPPAGATAEMWLDAWLADLDAIAAPSGDGHPLLRFAARGLALSAWLKEPTASVTPERLDDRAAGLAQIADEGGLLDRPRRRSLDVVARELRTLVDELLPRFVHLDDPTSHDDEEVQWYINNAGGSFGDALEVEVAAQPLFAAAAALVDLYGEVGPLLEAQPPAITSSPPRNSSVRFAPLAQYLSLVVAGDLDWAAAETAIDQIAADKRDERREDLAELRRLVADREYRRFASGGSKIGPHQLFVTAPHGRPEQPDVAPGIGRLGHDGILDAAHVVCWSAPDPEFRGPVESDVRATVRDDAQRDSR